MSQYKIARAYESGDGVEKNLSTARMWYQKSADNGYKNAEVKLRLLPVQEESAANETPKATEAPKAAYKAPATPGLSTPTGAQPLNTPKVPTATESQKSKIVAAVLAIFLGYFGAHDFYLGYKKNGLIKIIMTITVIGAFASYVWTLFDFIKIICGGKLDSDGQLLK